MKELARDLAHEALSLADSSASKVGVQSWFDSLNPSDHDRIDWVALASPVNEEEEDRKFEQGMADKYGPDAAIPPQAKSSQNSKIEKKAFDLSMNQDLQVGDKVIVRDHEGVITKLTRVHDVYQNEEEFNAWQDIYHNIGLTWLGNEIVTAMVDLGGIDEEFLFMKLKEFLQLNLH